MKIVLTLFLITISASLTAQHIFTLQEAIDHALANNPNVAAAENEIRSQRELRKTSFDLPKTEIMLTYGQYNSYVTNDNNISVTQNIPFAALGSNGRLSKEKAIASEFKKGISKSDLVFAVRSTYLKLSYQYSLTKLIVHQDSLFERFAKAAALRFKTGETNMLEYSTAELQHLQSNIRLKESESAILALRSQLKFLLNTESIPDIRDKEIHQEDVTAIFDTTLMQNNPSLHYLKQQIKVSQAEKKVQAASAGPDLVVGFFTQTLIGAFNPETNAVASSNDRFTGFQIGIALPLWYVPHQGRTRAATYNVKVAENNAASYENRLRSEVEQAIAVFNRSRESLQHYHNAALPTAELILKQSQTSFREGEINYPEFLLSLRNALEIKERHLLALHDYNHSIIQLEYLAGNENFNR